MLVKFTSKVPPYNAGEQADFPEAQAKRLVSSGVASMVAKPTAFWLDVERAEHQVQLALETPMKATMTKPADAARAKANAKTRAKKED